MKALTLAALIAAAPVASLADSLTLAAPLAGGTVHAAGTDLSAYWIEDGDAAELVAYYTTGGAAPQPLRLRLTEGDRVVFGLPGQSAATWSFAREAGAVTITGEALHSQLAMK